MNTMQTIEKEMMPVEKTRNFYVGDTVKVHYKIVEGNRERVQVYEGIVIAINNKGISKTFTVRKISFDIGVERVFPVFSPRIAKIEVTRKGKTRRAKLYFLRERTGKSTKLKEKRTTAGSSANSTPENNASSAEGNSSQPQSE
ncbi:MAG: 50S ribosomal protein L19 [Spirochaetes bacterium]|nr:50S ribosomal protein L19 [Spirochaetota bacterium]